MHILAKSISIKKRTLDMLLIFLVISFIVLVSLKSNLNRSNDTDKDIKSFQINKNDEGISLIKELKKEEGISSIIGPDILQQIITPKKRSVVYSSSGSANSVPSFILPMPVSETITKPEEKIHSELKKEIEENPEKTITVLVQVEEYEELKAKGLVLGDIGDKIKEGGGSVKGQFNIGNIIAVEIKAKDIEDIAGDDSVEGVWPNREVKAFLDNSVNYINAPSVWNLSYTGKNVKIAILDTGIDSNHTMLSGKVEAEAVFTGENHAYDGNGHGTHVAGIAAGKKTTEGYNGVAPDALLLNAKVLTDSGSGTTLGVLEGINWAVEQGADIISMSFGGAYNDLEDPINLAIKDAVEQGVTVAVASGNCGSGCNGYYGVTTPGNSPDAISVGAVDDNNNHAYFSSGENINGDIKPDVVAPGVDIISSVPNSYSEKSGTSMATPFISGAVALLLEAKSDLTPKQIKEILEHNTIDLGVKGDDVEYGRGVIDLSKITGSNIEVSSNEVYIEEGLTAAINVYNYGLSDLVINNVRYTNGITATIDKNTITTADFAILNIKASVNGTITVDSSDEIITIQVNIGSTPTEKTSGRVTINRNINTETIEFFKSLNLTPKKNIDEALKINPLSSDETETSKYNMDNLCVCNTCNDAYDISDFTRAAGDIINYAGDVDWFRKYFDEPGILEVILKVPSGVDYDFEVWGGCNNKLKTCQFFGEGIDEVCTIDDMPGGEINFKIYGYQNDYDPDNYYWLSTEFLAQPDKGYINIIIDNSNSDEPYDAYIILDDGAAWPVTIPAHYNDYINYGEDNPNFPVVGDEYHTVTVGFENDKVNLFFKEDEKYIPKGDVVLFTFTTTYCGDGNCDPDEDETTCSADCIGDIYLTADPRCSNNANSGGPCYSNANEQIGINNQYHSGSSSVSVPKYICYDWWNDNSQQAGIYKDGHYWDQCNYDYVTDTLWLSDPEAGSRTIRVLVAGYDSYYDEEIYSQDTISFEINIPSVCGNGVCEEDETKDSCSADCITSIKVIDFVNPPGSVVEGEFVTINAKVKNYGSNTESISMETAIIPDTWPYATIQEITPQHYYDMGKCCLGNEFYNAKDIVLTKGEEQIVPFSLYVPTRDSYNHCGDPTSAWGDSFRLYTELYPYQKCGVSAGIRKQISIEVIPDECKTDYDCDTGFKCDTAKDPNECVSLCQEPCAPNSYSCSEDGKSIAQCRLTEYGCYTYEPLTSCRIDEYCSNGQCRTNDKKTNIELEDADENIVVYKQPGDLIEVILHKVQNEFIDFQYDTAVFSSSDSNCGSGTKYILSDLSCLFRIAGDAIPGKEYYFGINSGDTETVKVIDNPTLLIITNKEKLLGRFENNEDGVNSLLKQAYQTATANKERGIVYDLNSYSNDHPWSDFSNYKEGDKDNILDYVDYISGFIAERCYMQSCNNIILLGDDFVIPYGRRNMIRSVFENNMCYENDMFTDNPQNNMCTYENAIFTDNPYIPITSLTLEEFNSDNVFSSGKITIVVPDYLTEYHPPIIKLKEVLYEQYGYHDDCNCFNGPPGENLLDPKNVCSNEWERVCRGSTWWAPYEAGNPIITSQEDIDVIHGEGVVCDVWENFNEFDETTLVMIGDIESNDAISCYPWITSASYPTLTLQRNMWDGKKASVLLYTSEEDSGYSLEMFNLFIDNYGTWVEVLPDDIQGFTILDAAEIAISFTEPYGTSIDLKDAAYFCTGVQDYGQSGQIQGWKRKPNMVYCTLSGVSAVIGFVSWKQIRAAKKGLELLEQVGDISKNADEIHAGKINRFLSYFHDSTRSLADVAAKSGKSDEFLELFGKNNDYHYLDALDNYFFQNGNPRSEKIMSHAMDILRGNAEIFKSASRIPDFVRFISLGGTADEFVTFQRTVGRIAAKSGGSRVLNSIGIRYGDDIFVKTIKSIEDFDDALKTIESGEVGIWTINQVDEIAEDIDKIKKGQEVRVYYYTKVSHFQDIIKQNRIDTDDLRRLLNNPNSVFNDLDEYRFGPKVYTSVDEATALKEVSKKGKGIFEENILFESRIKNADLADVDVVPSAVNIEEAGININGKKFEGGSIFELLNGVGTENLPDDEIKNILKNKDFKVVIIDERTGEVVAEKFVDGTTLYEGGDIIW